MATVVARGHFGAGFFGIEMIATNTVERNFSALRIVEFTVTPVVIKPKRAKHSKNQKAVQNDIEGKIGRSNHAEIPQEADAKGK